MVALFSIAARHHVYPQAVNLEFPEPLYENLGFDRGGGEPSQDIKCFGSLVKFSRRVGGGTESFKQSFGAFQSIPKVLVYSSAEGISWMDLESLRSAGKCCMARKPPLEKRSVEAQ